jgi:hypothetical protein
MTDYYEIDFLDVESPKSGDAITLRYTLGQFTYIHVVDAGFQATGEAVVRHVKGYYGEDSYVDHVVATHPDGDHAGGLRSVLKEMTVGELWMLRPWEYSAELLPRFATYNSEAALRSKLRELYPNLVALEEIAMERGIPIRTPFQGESIGAFRVMAPSKSRYLDLIVDSERTPEGVESTTPNDSVGSALYEALRKALLKVAEWGKEVFSANDTSAENEMSIVQFANLCGETILLTGDVGRGGLAEAADYADFLGVGLPGIRKFQVPHHGSRRNVSSDILDRWLGPKLLLQPPVGAGHFEAYISSAKADTHHPRKSVIRAMIHRGANVYWTEGQSIRTQKNAPPRQGWAALTAANYPGEQEES